MPTHSTHVHLVRLGLTERGLTRLAAGLALASAAPALAAPPADCPTPPSQPEAVVRTWTGPEQIVSGPTSGSISGPVVGYGAHGDGQTTYLRRNPRHGGLMGGPHDSHLRAKGARMHERGILPPGLAGYDAYLPPDAGWQVPVAYPVQREVYRYGSWYPHQWYGLPGSQKTRVAPHVFMPTDTTQLGYYHQQVPTWQPAPAGVFPAAPDPRVLHHTAQAGGPGIGAYPGIYPGEMRSDDTFRDPVTGQVIHGPGHGHLHGAPHGGTAVTEPAADGPTVNYGAELGLPATEPSEPRLDVQPLPSSTAPLPDAPVPGAPVPGAPVPDDVILPPAGEA